MALTKGAINPLQARRIRMARAGAQLSLESLADLIAGETGGWRPSRELLSNIEAGERDAESQLLRAISAATGESLSFLNGESDEAWTDRARGVYLSSPVPIQERLFDDDVMVSETARAA